MTDYFLATEKFNPPIEQPYMHKERTSKKALIFAS